MYHKSLDEAPKGYKEGLTSTVLLSKGQLMEAAMAVSWVEIKPGSRQILHSHEAAQIYVLIEGAGEMQVGEEKKQVKRGDIVYIPPNTLHGLVNTTEKQLTYVSAAAPPLDILAFYQDEA